MIYRNQYYYFNAQVAITAESDGWPFAECFRLFGSVRFGDTDTEFEREVFFYYFSN